MLSENPSEGPLNVSAEPSKHDDRHAMEDQLGKLSRQMGFQFLSVANSQRVPVAWMVREGDRVDVPKVAPATAIQGLSEYNGKLYRLVSTQIGQGDRNPGYLTSGETFGLAEFGVPVVLLHYGRPIGTNQTGVPMQQLAAAMGSCGSSPECDVNVNGASYLSIQIPDAELGGGYTMRSLQDMDAVAAPLLGTLNRVFWPPSSGRFWRRSW